MGEMWGRGKKRGARIGGRRGKMRCGRIGGR